MADRKKNRPQPGPIPRNDPHPAEHQDYPEQPEEVEQVNEPAPPEDQQDYQDTEDAEYAEQYDDVEENQALRAEQYKYRAREARGGPVLKNPITRDMVDSDRSAPVANLRGGLRGAGSSKSRNDKAVIIFFSVAVAIVLIALILPESWVRPGSQEQAPPEFAPEDVGWDKLDSMHERMVETEKEQLRRRQQAVRNKAATPSPEISVPETADTDELLENYSELLEPLPGEAATENAGTGNPDSGSLMRVNPGTPGAVPGGTSSSAGLPSSTGNHTQNLPPLDAGTALPRQSSPAPGSGLPTNSTGVSTPNDPEQQRKLRELEAEIELKLQSQENSTE